MPTDEELTRTEGTEEDHAQRHSLLGVNNLNFTGELGKRVVDDLMTGELAKKHQAAIRDRAKVNNGNIKSRQLVKKKMFNRGPIGGKLCAHNEFRLNQSVLYSVEKQIMKNNMTSLNTQIDKFDSYQKKMKEYGNLINNKKLPETMNNKNLHILISFLCGKKKGYPVTGLLKKS